MVVHPAILDIHQVAKSVKRLKVYRVPVTLESGVVRTRISFESNFWTPGPIAFLSAVPKILHFEPSLDALRLQSDVISSTKNLSRSGTKRMLSPDFVQGTRNSEPVQHANFVNLVNVDAIDRIFRVSPCPPPARNEFPNTVVPFVRGKH